MSERRGLERGVEGWNVILRRAASCSGRWRREAERIRFGKRERSRAFRWRRLSFYYFGFNFLEKVSNDLDTSTSDDLYQQENESI